MQFILLGCKDSQEVAQVVEALKPLQSQAQAMQVKPDEQAVLDNIAARAVA